MLNTIKTIITDNAINATVTGDDEAITVIFADDDAEEDFCMVLPESIEGTFSHPGCSKWEWAENTIHGDYSVYSSCNY
jgi:hypothetical protein